MKKQYYILAFIVILVVIAQPSECQSSLLTDLAAYYKLDDIVGQSALDSKGIYNSTSVNATQGVEGKLGTCYSFDGTDDKVVLPVISLGGNQMTLSAWAFFTTEGLSYKALIGRYYGHICIQTYSGTWTARVNNVGAAGTSENYLLGWQHVVLTYDGSLGSQNIKFYLNGVLKNTTNATGTLTHETSVWNIGTHGSNDRYWNGKIDEVGIWNRALTATEVTQLYNSGAGLGYPFGTSTAYTLSTSASPSAGGTIGLSPSGGSYASGTTVTATATANSGYTFTGWSGALTGTTNTGTVTMNANKTLTATFTPTSGGSDNLGNHTATQNIRLNNFWLSNDGGNEGISINNSGNVGIGINSPSSKLTVNGKILATEVEVVSSIASDFVFEPEYQLMPLTEQEIYLNQNKHLPDVPSAAEFSEKGQNLAETDDLLLKKIEELTLYILKQEKANHEQNQRILELQIKVDEFEIIKKELMILKPE